MTRLYVPLPLYSDSFYSYLSSLENQTYKIQILWNERANIWVLNLYLEDGTVLLLGERITPNYPLISEYNIDGLTGYFILVPKDEVDDEKYLTNARQLGQYYDFYYTYIGQ